MPCVDAHPSDEQATMDQRTDLQLANPSFSSPAHVYLVQLVFVMLSQLITAIRNTTSSQVSVQFGQDVVRGLYNIPELI